MNAFTIKLNSVIKEAGLSRKEISELTGLGFPAISKYLNGKMMPKALFLAKIMNELPHEKASELLIAYLRELLVDYDGLEAIFASIQSSSQDISRNLMSEDGKAYNASASSESAEDKELRMTVQTLLLLAQAKPEVASMLKALVASLKP